MESVNLPNCTYLPEPYLPSLENDIPVNDPVDENQQSGEQTLPNENETLSECLNSFPQETVVTEQPSSLDAETDSQHAQTPPRRSQRSHDRPERLRYSRLGHPLLYVVNAVFSSLNEAITNSMQQFDHLDAQGHAYHQVGRV